MTADIAYHLTELKIVSNKGDPRRVVPNYSCGGWRVLDIGCGIGQTLVSEELSEAAELYGVDSDSELVNCPVLTDREPRLRLMHAAAESLPFPCTYFDLVYSRVAVPYTNIPVAMSEAFRVLKPGGHLWMTLHPWRMGIKRLLSAITARKPRAMADRLYVLTNSLLFASSGRLAPRPWDGTYESLQTAYAMRRVLARAGFVGTRCQISRSIFLATASKPAGHDTVREPQSIHA
jgi:ubiquinone/menaquinone biosynthesis C-methylase UbiE